MAVVIQNVSDHDGSKRPSDYIVRINNQPIIARFQHMRPDGLAECLRRAAEAVDQARK